MYHPKITLIEMHSFQPFSQFFLQPQIISTFVHYLILSFFTWEKETQGFHQIVLDKKKRFPLTPQLLSTPIKRGANEVKPRFRARNLSETKRCHIQSYCPEIFANTLVPPFTFIFLRFLPFTRPIILSLNGGERRGTLSA